ncbi:hypothetical protein [Kushneria phyllosphaerae]|nr:hypothetical protein [Kushneria phyllosphaerae]
MPYYFDAKKLPKEYHQRYLATQTMETLVHDEKNSISRNGILKQGVKKDIYQWSYQPIEYLSELINPELIIKAAAEHLYSLVKKPEYRWLTAIISRINYSRNFLNITTRFDLYDLDNILRDPSLSIHSIHQKKLGDFSLKKEKKSILLLKNKKEIKYNFRLLETNSCKEGKNLFEKGLLDICWGIGTPSSFFNESDTLFPHSGHLPLNYFIKAGSKLENNTWNSLVDFFSNLEISCVAINQTSHRLSREKISAAPFTTSFLFFADKALPLYYSDYPPNDEVAVEICSKSNGKLFPKKIPYENIVMSNSKIQDGVILSIQAPRHGGIVGNYPELYFLSKNNLTSNKEYQKLLETLFKQGATWYDDSAIFKIEKKINKEMRQHFIGQLKPRFRSKYTVPIDQLGLIKLSNIE